MLSESVQGKPISYCASDKDSKTIRCCIESLSQLRDLTSTFPPLVQDQRFGNKAFRDWHKKMTELADDMLLAMLPSTVSAAAVVELQPYWISSFGDPVRIDYGSGHEALFLAFCLVLSAIGALSKEDAPAIVLRLFVEYLKTFRHLQITYMLEPAGSHGVFGVDDYSFLPFLFGSSQLIDHPRITPVSVLEANVVEDGYSEYMYLDAIRFINQCKKGAFHEHSRVLYNITDCPHWQKVNGGMIKMYRAEVLQKVRLTH